MKRARAVSMILALACLLVVGSAAAQPAATEASPAPAAQTPAPAAAAAAPETAAPTEPAAAPSDAPAGTQPAPSAPAAQGAADSERAHVELERARLRMELARARSQRQAATAAPPTPPVAQTVATPAVRGDAGAALAIGFTLEMPWNTDVGFDLFSKDDVVERYGVWAAYDVLSVRDDVILAPEIGIAADLAERNHVLGGILNSRIESTVLHAGAQLRYVPLDWLQPHVRFTAGVQLVSVELTSGGKYEDSGTLPFGSLSGGVMLRTPTRLFENRQGRFASLSFGFLIEGGYTLVAPLSVTLDGDGPSGRDIALDEASLGELDRSGPFVRTSLVARY